MPSKLKSMEQPEMIMQRALKSITTQSNQLETKIERDKPKIVFADAVAATKTINLVGELARSLNKTV